MWTVLLKKSVRRRLELIPNPDKERIKRAINTLAYAPELLDIKPLKGRDDYRLRVGDWRLILDIDENKKIITVNRLSSRGDVYKS